MLIKRKGNNFSRTSGGWLYNFRVSNLITKCCSLWSHSMDISSCRERLTYSTYLPGTRKKTNRLNKVMHRFYGPSVTQPTVLGQLCTSPNKQNLTRSYLMLNNTLFFNSGLIANPDCFVTNWQLMIPSFALGKMIRFHSTYSLYSRFYLKCAFLIGKSITHGRNS